MALQPHPSVPPARRPWHTHLLTVITPSGREARLRLDPHSAMVTLLRQPWLAAPWGQRTTRLALAFDRPDSEGHRLLVHAIHQDWVGLHPPGDRAMLALRDLLDETGIISQARLQVLDRRLDPDRPLRLEAVGESLARIGWCRPADHHLLRQLAPLARWHWRI